MEVQDVVNLFENPNAPTDMRFEVEGKIIPFYKALLTVSSPVFGRMLATDFKEAQTNTVQLPDKKSYEIILFLGQLHPAHAWKPLTEKRLECLLRLADEYDVAHVKMKCQAFIREQLEFDLTTEQVLKYLWLCDSHSLDEVRADLTTVAVDHTQTELEECSYFFKLNTSTQLEVMRKLCRSLQNEKNAELKTLMNTGQFIRKLKEVVKALPALTPPEGEKCEVCMELAKIPLFTKAKCYLSFSVLKHTCSKCLPRIVTVVLQTANENFGPLRKTIDVSGNLSLEM